MDHYTKKEIQVANDVLKVVKNSKDKHLQGVFMAGQILQWLEWQVELRNIQKTLQQVVKDLLSFDHSTPYEKGQLQTLQVIQKKLGTLISQPNEQEETTSGD